MQPQAFQVTVQFCIVYQICNSIKYVASKNQKEFMMNLKFVYLAINKDALEHLRVLKASGTRTI